MGGAMALLTISLIGYFAEPGRLELGSMGVALQTFYTGVGVYVAPLLNHWILRVTRSPSQDAGTVDKPGNPPA